MKARQSKFIESSKVQENLDTYASIRRLISYMKPFIWLVILSILFAILNVFFTILAPLIMGNTTNYVVESFTSDRGFVMAEFMRYIYLLLGTYVLAMGTDLLRGIFGTRLNSHIVYNMRRDISEKVKTLPISYFDQNQVGDLLSRMTNDIQTIADSLHQIINNFLKSLTTILGMGIIMLMINPRLTIVTVLIVPTTIFSAMRIARISQKSFSQQWEELGDLNGHIEEIFSNNKLVKSYNYQEKALGQFDEKNQKMVDSGIRAYFYSGIMMPISVFVNNLGVVAVTTLGGFLVIQGAMNIGNLQSFIQYSRRFTGPISDITNVMSIVQAGVAASGRVFELLDQEEEVQEIENPASLKGLDPNVSLEDVSFGYNPDKMVLKNINLQVRSGESIAIVGPTGSGKTTLVNLLMRFYDIDSGSIKIDGVDIRDVRRSELRKYSGMVLQDTWLFQGTIADNISYGRPDASRDDIVQAAKSAHCHEFIMGLDKGYDTILEDNASNISQGQKQLITIARALVTNPHILILDEATSSVDTKTERLIQKALDTLIQGRTSFIIAHRLSTIINSDQILVLKDGEIIEKGNHRELLAEDGFYKELYQSQF